MKSVFGIHRVPAIGARLCEPQRVAREDGFKTVQGLTCTRRRCGSQSRAPLLLAFVLVLGIVGHTLAADPVSDTLQKGLFEEEANHNLDAAIKAYQSVIDQTAEQRKLTATAVFRLGECYRKLNKTNEAVAQYQRLIREFSDQAPLVKLSEQNLTTLGVRPAGTQAKPASAPPQEDPEAKEIARLERLAKDSPDLLNAKDNSGDTPLHQAAARGQRKVIEFLLANKIEVNTPDKNRTLPLHYAANYNQKAAVELLLSHGAEVNAFGGFGNSGSELYWCQPLHMAVHRGNQSMAELLLNHKADVNGLDDRRRTPLHFAVDQGFLGLVRLLLSKGADPNPADQRGRTPAASAALTGYEHILRLLIDSGADVNTQDRDGNTLAHYTVVQQSSGMLKTVLDRKPDLELENNNRRTPLLGAVEYGGPQAIERLLQAGANPNALNDKGLFPLMAAVDKPNKEAVRLLLAHKADPNQMNPEGLTALSRANARSLDDKLSPPEKKQLREIAELLRQHGAKLQTARVPFIGIGRGTNIVAPQFLQQDPNGLNHFTLFEFIYYLYGVPSGPQEGGPPLNFTSLLFPDFARIRIHRLTGAGDDRQEINVDLQDALTSGDCSKDMVLEWGDIIELPERDHKVNEMWTGLPVEVKETGIKCLERQVSITVKGETTQVLLRPNPTPGPVPKAVPPSRPIRSSGNALSGGNALTWLRLKNVLAYSGLLRASSDQSRVKVVRTLPGTNEKREVILNLEIRNTTTEDLLLRDGDEIYVPEKT